MIEEAVAYVKRFGYINDERYVQITVARNGRRRRAEEKSMLPFCRKGFRENKLMRRLSPVMIRKMRWKQFAHSFLKRGIGDMDENQKQSFMAIWREKDLVMKKFVMQWRFLVGMKEVCDRMLDIFTKTV